VPKTSSASISEEGSLPLTKAIENGQPLGGTPLPQSPPPKKTKSRSKHGELYPKAKEVYSEWFEKRFDVIPVWAAKQNTGMSNLLTELKIKISHKKKTNKEDATDAEVLFWFDSILNNMPEWYTSHNCTILTLAANIDEIIIDIKTKQADEKPKTDPAKRAWADNYDTYHTTGK
jgi:hypothetical protein